MKIIRWILIPFVFLIPNLAFAVDLSKIDIFSPPATDYSVKFLGQLFGSVGTVLIGNESVIAKLMSAFNSAVLVLGGILIVYTIIVSTMNTAHQGEILGQKWSSLWIPIRAAFGLSMLVPQGSGYSFIQILMMWVVVQGVGSADNVWDTALDYFNKGGAVYSGASYIPIAQYAQLSADTLKMMMCAYTAWNYFQKNYPGAASAEMQFPGLTSSLPMQLSKQPTSFNVTSDYYYFPGNIYLREGPGKTQTLNISASCGTITNDYWNLNKYTVTQHNAVTQGINSLIINLNEVAQNLAKSAYTTSDPRVYTAIYNGAQMYRYAILDVQKDNKTDYINAATLKQMKDEGWIMAGSYYYTLSALNQQVQKAVSLLASTGYADNLDGFQFGGTGTSSSSTNTHVDDVASGIDNVEKQVYAAFVAEDNKATGRASFNFKPDAYSGVVGQILGAITLGMSNITHRFEDLFTQNQKQPTTNPISMIAAFGSYILIQVEQSWVAGAATMFTLGLLSGLLGCIQAAINAVLKWLIPVITLIMGAMVVVGATLAYYVPLIPFLLFIFGGIGWMIGVIEAMVAAPIVAVAITHPEGNHDFLGKAEPAVYLILSLFLRPVLMIIGMVAGMTLSYVVLNFFNSGFMMAFQGVQQMADVQSGWLGLFPPLIIMIIYTAVVVIIVRKTFELINIIPDRVLTWFEGGQGAASHFGQEAKDMAQLGEQKIGGGIQSMGDAHSRATSGSIESAESTGQSLGGTIKSAARGNDPGGETDENPGNSGGGDQANEQELAELALL